MEIRNFRELEDGSVVFELEESSKEWEETLNSVSAAMQKEKPIQGYRPGKAPLAIAFNEYGQAMIDQAEQEFVNSAVEKVCTEHEYYLLSGPEKDVEQADLTTLRAKVGIVPYPKANDFDYVGFEVVKPVKTVTEADIDEAMRRFMKGYPYVHEVDRAAEKGDTVEVSFTGTCNGEPFEFDHSDSSHFRMGANSLFYGLDDHLMGHVAGDDVEVTLTIPDDFHRKAIRGKTLDLKVHLKSVSVREIVECTDEFVQEKIAGANTVAEFREQQRDKLKRLNDSRTEKAFDRNLQKALASLVTCPVPEPMVSVSVDGFVRAMRSLAVQQGQTLNQYLQGRKQTLESFKKSVHPLALMQVKVSIALDYILSKENFEVSDEAVEEKIQSFMKNSRLPHDKALEKMGGRENIEEKVKQEMAYDFVKEHCKVVETEVDVIPTGFGQL